jgi:hypothetical protein
MSLIREMSSYLNRGVERHVLEAKNLDHSPGHFGVVVEDYQELRVYRSILKVPKPSEKL